MKTEDLSGQNRVVNQSDGAAHDGHVDVETPERHRRRRTDRANVSPTTKSRPSGQQNLSDGQVESEQPRSLRRRSRVGKATRSPSTNIATPDQPEDFDDDDLVLDDLQDADVVVDAGRAIPTLQASDRQPIEELVHLWRMRQAWHRAEKSLILQGRARCRSYVMGSGKRAAKLSKEEKAEASKLFNEAYKGNCANGDLAYVLAPFIAAINEFRPLRLAIEKQLTAMVRELPAYPYVQSVKGFGELNFAGLVGEAGDIGSYQTVARLWKRMGLAVINGERQARKSDKELALLHGYNPARRAVAYLLGECLIKAGPGCVYRPLYDARRAHTAVTHPDWSKKHSHHDAMRIITKRAALDLWRAWRGLPMRGAARIEPEFRIAAE